MSSSIPETSIKYIYVYVMWVSRHASASRPCVDGRLWSLRRSFIEALDKSHGMYKSNTTKFKVYFSHSCICKHGRDYTFGQLIHIVLPLSSRRDTWGRKHGRRCLWVGVQHATATRNSRGAEYKTASDPRSARQQHAGKLLTCSHLAWTASSLSLHGCRGQ